MTAEKLVSAKERRVNQDCVVKTDLGRNVQHFPKSECVRLGVV